MEKYSKHLNIPKIDRVFLLWIFFLALAVRIIWLFQYQESPTFNYPLLDFTYFESRAREIMNGQLFSEDYLFNPLYPLYLAAVFKTFGSDLFFPRLIQVILGSLNTLLIYYLGTYAFSRYTGIIAAVITALYLPMIYFDGILMATSLITFLLLFMISLLVFGKSKNQIIFYIISGFSMGIIVLGRPNFLLAAIALTIWILWDGSSGPFRRRYLRGLIFFVCTLAVISPISIQYWIAHNEFIIVAPHGGINFYIGNNPDATGAYTSVPGISDVPGEQVKDSVRIASEQLGHAASPSETSA